MADINLLPQELKPNKSVLIIAKKLKKTSIIFASFFVLTFLIIIGLQYYYSKKITQSVNSQMELESQIKSMESTEQQLVLIKDRIEKIISIAQKGTVDEEVDVVSKVSDLAADGMVVKSISIDKDLVQITVVTNSLTLASKYLSSVTSLQGLKYINLISFDFSPTLGYTIDLNFIANPGINSAAII